MERAAQLRAQGKQWPEIAETLGYSESTVEHYPTRYPPFGELVDYYQQKLHQEEIDRLIRDLEPEALRAFEQVVESRADVGTEQGPSWSDLIRAAVNVLSATGFKERQRLKAREEVQGTTADKVEMSGPDGGPIETRDETDDDPDAELVAEAARLLEGDDDGDG